MGVFTCRTARAHGTRGRITSQFAVLLAVATSHTLAQGPTCLVLMVNDIAKMIYLPATLAQRLGYPRDEGLDAGLLSQPAGVNAEGKLLTGSAQGVAGFYDHTIDLQAKGKEVRAIVVFSQVPGETGVVSTRLPATVQSMRDLRDRMLDVTGLGASTSFLTRYPMVQQGLSADDCAMLPVGVEHSFVTALRNDRIDTGMITDLTVSRLLHGGEARVLFDLHTLKST